MLLDQAKRILKCKYYDEIEDTPDRGNTDEYNLACETYPALMSVAHHLWALEIAKEQAEQLDQFAAGGTVGVGQIPLR